jgi:Transposase
MNEGYPDGPGLSSAHRGRAMKRGGDAFVGIDTAKARNAVTVAEGGRQGELRYLGEFDANPDVVAKLVRKLADRYATLHFCYEAGPTGYGLYRQIGSMGHECTVVAPSLIPRRPGERAKTNRQDWRTLARLHRAGELTAVWVPDETHEAVRDLVRTRTTAVEDYRCKRQHITAFFLRQGRIFEGKTTWGATFAVVGHTKLCSSGAAVGVPGNAECSASGSGTNRSVGCHAVGNHTGMDDGAGGRRISGSAWRRVHECRNAGRRGRRHSPF